jgi:hypothetical protein
MTDTPTAINAGLSPAQFDGAISALREAGVSEEIISSRLGTTSSTSPAPGTTAAPANPLAPSRVQSELAGALLAGGMSREKVEAAAANDGFLLPPEPGPAGDWREREHDRMFSAPATPDEYKIELRNVDVGELDAGDPAKFGSAIKNVLHAASLPAAIGSAVAEMGLEDASHWQGLDASSRATWDAQQLSELGRIAKDPQEAVKNASAVIAVMRDKNPEFVKALVEHGAFRSARVVAQLDLHARRQFARADLAVRRTAAAAP